MLPRARSAGFRSALGACIHAVPIWLWPLALIVVPMLLQVALQWNSFPPLQGKTIGPTDPDPWLRLVLVREWLLGGGWYNHSVSHSNAPLGGISSPWTRPLDVVIGFFTWLQPETVDINLRLVRTALLLPPLWMALLLLGLYRNLRLLCPLPPAPFLVTALIASCLPMWAYWGAGNADHHALLAVLFVWAMCSVLAPSPSTRATILTGVLLGLQLWISPEALVLIAAVYGWYGIAWLRGDAACSRPWALLAITVAFTTTAALMIERPVALWFTPVYDSLSIVYVLLVTLVAVAVLSLSRVHPKCIFQRALVALGALLAVGGAAVYSFPLILRGPMAQVDPYILTHFLPRITEAQSPFTQSLALLVGDLWQALLALLLLAAALCRRPAILGRTHLLQLGYFLLMTGALYATQQRFYYYFYPLTAMVLTSFLAAFYACDHPAIRTTWPARWLVAQPMPRQALQRISLLLLVLGVPFVVTRCTAPAATQQASSPAEPCVDAAMAMIEDGTLVRALGDQPLILFAPTDIGAQVLFFTPYRIVASNYHREGAGIRYLWEADTLTDPAALRKYLAQRQVDALLLCPSNAPTSASALQQLQHNKQAFSWLVSVPYASDVTRITSGSAPALFRVRRGQ